MCLSICQLLYSLFSIYSSPAYVYILDVAWGIDLAKLYCGPTAFLRVVLFCGRNNLFYYSLSWNLLTCNKEIKLVLFTTVRARGSINAEMVTQWYKLSKLLLVWDGSTLDYGRNFNLIWFAFRATRCPKIPSWTGKIACSPEARDYFLKPGLFSEARISLKKKVKFSYFYGYFYEFRQIYTSKESHFVRNYVLWCQVSKFETNFCCSQEKVFLYKWSR